MPDNLTVLIALPLTSSVQWLHPDNSLIIMFAFISALLTRDEFSAGTTVPVLVTRTRLRVSYGEMNNSSAYNV